MTDGTPAPASADAGSEGTQDASTAAPAAGSPDVAQFETRVRHEQGRADRAEARIKELEAKMSEAQTPTPPAAEKPVDPEQIVAQALSRFRATEDLRSAAKDLRGEFEYADESLFDKAEDFESPEALRAAAEASHGRVASLVTEAVEKATADLHAEMKTKYGIDLAPSTPQGEEGKTPAGDPTIEQLQSMPFSEMAALDPEVVDRVLRSAT